jgi:uncharacterized protein (TIGR02001 family)
MRAWKTGLLAAAAAFTLGGTAWAQEPPTEQPAASTEPAALDTAETGGGPDFAFNVGIASDYVFRGISQTDEGLQVFGGADVAIDSFYAGVWASNLDFSAFGDSKTELEVDFYAGVKPELSGFALDFGVIYYTYFDQPDGAAELNYVEFKAAASRAVGPVTLGGAVYFSPEFTAEVGEATYFEANGSFAANDRLTVSGALGRQTFDELDGADYTTWNIGATFAVTPNVGVDVRYWDTDEDDIPGPAGDLYEGRVVASLKLTV